MKRPYVVLWLLLCFSTVGLASVCHGQDAPDPCISGITSGFNGTPIGSGRTVWFNGIAKLKPQDGGTLFLFSNQQIQVVAGGTAYTIDLPDSLIFFDAYAQQATTVYNGFQWETTVPAGYTGNIFLGGTAWPLPDGLPGGARPVTWSGDMINLGGDFAINVSWKWAAAVYSDFTQDLNGIDVKPVDGDKLNPYMNSDHAGTPENFKNYVVGGATGGGGSNFTGSYSGTASKSSCFNTVG